jgi:hypothetical protein
LALHVLVLFVQNPDASKPQSHLEKSSGPLDILSDLSIRHACSSANIRLLPIPSAGAMHFLELLFAQVFCGPGQLALFSLMRTCTNGAASL